MRRFLLWLTQYLRPPRVIWDREGASPYLTRWYLLPWKRPRHSSGAPFNDDGSPKPDIRWRDGLFNLHLHRFHASDSELELHNHPWRWAVSLILAGGYIEERRVEVYKGTYAILRRFVKPWSFNIIRSDTFHRVDLLGNDAWSLFLTGPKFASWGFWCRFTGIFTPWREFIDKRRGLVS